MRDVLTRAEEQGEDVEPLLCGGMTLAERVTTDHALEELRLRFRREFACLLQRHKALRSPERDDLRISTQLEKLREGLVRETREREISSGGKARL